MTVMIETCEECDSELEQHEAALYANVDREQLAYGVLCEECLQEQASDDEIAEEIKQIAQREIDKPDREKFTIRVGIRANSEGAKVNR